MRRVDFPDPMFPSTHTVNGFISQRNVKFKFLTSVSIKIASARKIGAKLQSDCEKSVNVDYGSKSKEQRGSASCNAFFKTVIVSRYVSVFSTEINTL